jgi:hypothetical protein
MILVPLTQPGNLNLAESQEKNQYIVVRWIFFTFMLISVCIICLPLFALWKIMLIPQRVDSRAARDYHDKYEKMLLIEKDKLKKEKERVEQKKMTLEVENNINNDKQIVNQNNNENVAIPVRDVQPMNNQEERKKKTVSLRRKAPVVNDNPDK